MGGAGDVQAKNRRHAGAKRRKRSSFFYETEARRQTIIPKMRIRSDVGGGSKRGKSLGRVCWRMCDRQKLNGFKLVGSVPHFFDVLLGSHDVYRRLRE